MARRLISLCLLLFAASIAGQTCPGGLHHLAQPVSNLTYAACTPWSRENSCCSQATDSSIYHHDAVQLYNFNWTHCGPLSAACETFLEKVRTCPIMSASGLFSARYRICFGHRLLLMMKCVCVCSRGDWKRCMVTPFADDVVACGEPRRSYAGSSAPPR